jgi:hypothetical protein
MRCTAWANEESLEAATVRTVAVRRRSAAGFHELVKNLAPRRRQTATRRHSSRRAARDLRAELGAAHGLDGDSSSNVRSSRIADHRHNGKAKARLSGEIAQCSR